MRREVTFEIGTVESCTEVVVVDDSLSLEGEETIVVSFTAPPGTQQGSPPSSTVSILDNDGQDQEHLQYMQTHTERERERGERERESSIVFILMFLCVSLSAEFVVRFIEDYSYQEGEGDTVVCVEGVGQTAHPATITISSLTGGTATGEDLELFTFLFLVTKISYVVQSACVCVCFEVCLFDIALSLSLDGQDYFTVVSQQVTLTPNAPSPQEHCFPVLIFDDIIAEDDEFFILEFQSVPSGVVVGARNTTVVTIEDNDGQYY